MPEQDPSAPPVWLSTREVALRLGLHPSVVAQLITNRMLRAMNVSVPGSQRATYRIREEWVEEYAANPPLDFGLWAVQSLKEKRKPVLRDRRQGIYFLWKGDRIVYVGQTRSSGGALSRMGCHAAEGKDFDAYTFLPIRGDLDVIEQRYIRELDPPLNHQRRQIRKGEDGRLFVGRRRTG